MSQLLAVVTEGMFVRALEGYHRVEQSQANMLIWSAYHLEAMIEKLNLEAMIEKLNESYHSAFNEGGEPEAVRESPLTKGVRAVLTTPPRLHQRYEARNGAGWQEA